MGTIPEEVDHEPGSNGPSKKARAMGVEALRTRADAKARLAPIIKELQAAGKTSLRAVAAGLNEAGAAGAADEPGVDIRQCTRAHLSVAL